MSNATLLAQIAPQRSTQYAELASELAPVELMLSPLQPNLQLITPRTLGNQAYLQLELGNQVDEHKVGSIGTSQPTMDSNILSTQAMSVLGSLAMTTAYFWLHEQIRGIDGPFLQPIETGYVPSQPPKLIATRRYRGKTNELFTQWLCNVAKFSSDFATAPWESLTLMDPLAGGGTTLLAALVLGAETAAGIEQDQKDGKSTATFLKQFADENRIPVRLREERLKKLGRRWTVSLGEEPALRAARLEIAAQGNQTTSVDGPENTRTTKANVGRNSADRQSFVWVQGDTSHAQELLPGFRPHLVVADLPYGIQHQGQLVQLLDQALPVWSAMLRKGGTVALAWDATRFSSAKMHECLEAHQSLQLLLDSPYDQLAHRVDRVIKQRDVVILKKG